WTAVASACALLRGRCGAGLTTFSGAAEGRRGGCAGRAAPASAPWADDAEAPAWARAFAPVLAFSSWLRVKVATRRARVSACACRLAPAPGRARPRRPVTRETPTPSVAG